MNDGVNKVIWVGCQLRTEDMLLCVDCGTDK